jgi:predicted secreted protein
MKHTLPAAVLVALTLSTGLPSGVSAQSSETKAAAPSTLRTRLALRETAAREVEQDTIEAVLTARSEASAAGKAQVAVNRLMDGLLTKAKAASDITVSTSGYRVSQDYTSEGRPRAWVAQQDLNLKSADSTELLGLIGDLQADGVLLARLDYVLSDKARQSLTDELTLEAIKKLQARATKVAEALNARVVNIDTMSVSDVDGGPRPMPRMMMATADAAKAKPVAEAGVETVQVTVDANIVLEPK